MEPFYHLGFILKGRLPYKAYHEPYHTNQPETLLRLQPLRLPKSESSKWVRRLSEAIVLKQIAGKGFKPDWILSFSPFFSFLKERLRVPFIYYGVDSYPQHQYAETETLADADLAVAATETLYRHFKGRTQRVEYLPHGVSLSFVDNYTEPAELFGLPRPILGFVGALNEYFDIALLERLSQAYSKGSVVLVGPYEQGDFGGGMPEGMLTRIRRLTNVHLLGRRTSDQLGAYISSFDVCLVLKDISHPLVHFSYSKVLQYLALGKPVVTTCFASDSVLPPHVAIASDHDSFIKAVDRALASHDDAAAETCCEFASQNTWEHRVIQISNWAEEVI